MLANIKSPNAPRLYALTLNYYVLVTLMIGAGLAIFAREIVLIIGTPAYLPSIGLVSILVVRQILPGVDYITGCGIVISKKTIFTSLALGAGRGTRAPQARRADLVYARRPGCVHKRSIGNTRTA